MGGPFPTIVSIGAYADADNLFAGDVISLEFGVVGDPAAAVPNTADLMYNPGNGRFPYYTSQYEAIQVTITSFTMSENTATVAGSFSAKLTRAGPASQDGEQDFATLEGTFEVEAWPVSY